MDILTVYIMGFFSWVVMQPLPCRRGAQPETLWLLCPGHSRGAN